MATTIQVAEETLAQLKKAKEEMGVASYDELVRRLLMLHRKRTMPLRGITPGLGPFVRDHGHRD